MAAMDATSSPARASVQGSESASGSASGLASRPAAAGRWTTEHVLSMRRWTPTLISFRTTRPPGFRFTPGHYVFADDNGLVVAAQNLLAD